MRIVVNPPYRFLAEAAKPQTQNITCLLMAPDFCLVAQIRGFLSASPSSPLHALFQARHAVGPPRRLYLQAHWSVGCSRRDLDGRGGRQSPAPAGYLLPGGLVTSAGSEAVLPAYVIGLALVSSALLVISFFGAPV